MIVISKDKIYHEYFQGGFKVSSDIAKLDVSLVRYLSEVVYVEEDVTVEDLMRHLIDYRSDIDYAMESSLGGYSLEMFTDELISSDSPEENLKYAEFCHEVKVLDGFVVHTPRFGAVGINMVDESDMDMVPYSIELSPISAYKHLPIVINREYSVVRIDDVDGKQVETVLFEAQKDFTLYEFLHAFLFEISYYGTPTMRAAALQEVVKSIGQGEDYNISASHVDMLRLTEITRLEEELETSIANEDYERSAELRDKINQLKVERSNQSATNKDSDV